MIDLVYKPNPYLYKNDYLKSELATNDFPSGLAYINFKWNDYIKQKVLHLQFYAGFIGSRQYKNKSLEPFISWAITDTVLMGLPIERDIHPDQYRSAVHSDAYWSPHFAKKVTDSAVFDIKRFKTTQASLKYIRQVILDSLKQSQLFNDSLFKTKKVAIEIFSNGSVGQVFLIDSAKKGYNDFYYPISSPNKLELYIKHILESQTKHWFPAIAHPVDFIDYLNPEHATVEEKKAKVKANSVITLRL